MAMSDQTPTSGEPTPTPTEGVGTGAEHDATPPPPPPTSTAVDEMPPPPPEKKSRTGLIVAIIAGLVVLAIAAVVAVVLVVNKGEDTHSISITKTAAGMKRDTTKEGQLKQQLTTAEQQFKTQAKNVVYVKSGVYQQDDAKRGPVGSLVFLGAKLSKPQSPAAFVSSFEKQATANGFKVSNIAAGDGGGKAVCAYQSSGEKVAVCAWATTDTMGELVPTTPGYDAKQIAKIMLALRADVEKTE